MSKTVYAGLDVDSQAKLFYISDEKDFAYVINGYQWLEILDKIGAEEGDMLIVSFSKQSENND